MPLARHDRLLDAVSPRDLLKQVITEAESAASNRTIHLCWQESDALPGYHRLSAQIPLSETTFDQLFNGNSGYRAQYYLSPEEGILFNRDILQNLLPVIRAYNAKRLCVPIEHHERSILAPHAKIWIYDDKSAFNEASPNTLNPQRWIDNKACRGNRAPLPKCTMLDLKGAFINFATDDLFVDECKLDRAWDLYSKGFT